MKALLTLLLLCSIPFFAFSQNVISSKQITDLIHISAAGLPNQQHTALNTPPAGTASGVQPIQVNPHQLQSIQRAVSSLPKRTGAINLTARQQAFPCIDTSYIRLIGITNASLYLQSITGTTDHGILVSAMMYDTSAPLANRWSKGYGILLKLDESGNINWLKQFEETSPGYSAFGSMGRTFELANHDIIYTTLVDTSNYAEEKTVIYRLSSTGTILWKNCLQSNMGIFNSPVGTFRFWVTGAMDGLNGDVILCGTNNSNLSSGKLETVVRLNSLGQRVWDANYGNHGYDGSYLLGAEGVSTFIENGQIVLVGISHGSTYMPTPGAITFLTLDYNNGNLITKRFFKPAYTDANTGFLKSFTYYYNRFVRLDNGHSLFYGKLFSVLSRSTPLIDHFGVVEFDQSYNVVNAYSISSPVQTNYYNDLLHFDRSGKGLISAFQFTNWYDGNIIFASINNRQFLNERWAVYNNVGMPGENGFTFLNDSGYLYMQTHFDVQAGTKSYFEFRKMHDSDTSSTCLGTDTSLLSVLPLNYTEDPSYPFLDANEPNNLAAVPLTVNQTDTLTTNRLNPCIQSNYCDTVKIHGTPTICGGVSYLDFTSYKRNVCGGNVQWAIDNTITDSMKITSDTSMRVWFKNTNWQGRLYASITGSTCYTPAIDSMAVTIIKAQAQIDLGANNSILCAPNTRVLHAGNYFSTYKWQDGSTDSLLTVTTAGKYWVEASDFCGNTVSDTIIILPFTATISVGPDRVKCNRDTLRLNAPAGFLNYQWSNNYNISSTTAQNVVVNPLVDTAYYIKAEKIPGCFVYDTVRVTVQVSPPIQLGPDVSFCSGDTLLLDAGSGFASYVWNTTEITRQIRVIKQGSYSVIGAMANGCRSYDTLLVLNLWPKPVFTLNHNPNLCTGESRTLSPGNFFSYLWQDGSTGSTFEATGTGQYYVTVQNDHQCKASDTVNITAILPLPAGFLPADTALCNYGKLEIKPSKSFPSYVWSTGETASSITVKKAGIYWLRVTDSYNCPGTDSIIILQKDCLTGFYIPNAFTPNQDGRNDTFKPIIGGIVERYQFTIYNRWGQVVFSSSDINKGWDGTLGGIKQDANVFLYTCRFKLEGDSEKLERGTVVLLR